MSNRRGFLGHCFEIKQYLECKKRKVIGLCMKGNKPVRQRTRRSNWNPSRSCVTSRLCQMRVQGLGESRSTALRLFAGLSSVHSKASELVGGALGRCFTEAAGLRRLGFEV